jgi:hypothetical protein
MNTSWSTYTFILCSNRNKQSYFTFIWFFPFRNEWVMPWQSKRSLSFSSSFKLKLIQNNYREVSMFIHWRIFVMKW